MGLSKNFPTSAGTEVLQEGGGSLPLMKKYNWPKPDVSLIAQATEHGRGFDDLPGRSPVRLDPCHTPMHYLQALFDPDPKSYICIADGCVATIKLGR